MAQYFLQIASSADLTQFAVVTTGTLTYLTDSGRPVLSYVTASDDFGKFIRFLDVPSAATMQVRTLTKAVSGTSGFSRNGPVARLNGTNGTSYGRNTGTTYRGNQAIDDVWTEWSTNQNGMPAGSTYMWMEINCSGSSLEGRSWTEFGSRPASAEKTGTTTLVSGFAGFGRPGSASTSEHYLAAIAVGTDGDAAPTGPVAGRARSRLILTPW